MRRVSVPLTPRPSAFGVTARFVAVLALVFVLAGVIAPRLVNAHDTLRLVAALILYALAAAALAWGVYVLVAGLRRRGPPDLDVRL